MRQRSIAGSNNRVSIAGGFVLIEVLAAIIVIALALGIAFAAIPRGTSSPRLMAIAREIATFLTIARTDALLSGHETLTVIDGEHRTITSANQVLTLPADVSLAVLSAESCRRSETSVGVLFRRDGSSCGAVIRIARPGGQGLRIRVNWYTGHIEILSA